tara:strand:+ start:186 stop:587 length:402 start_codon:yes stop_codon:yes gene_type:complete
MTTLLHRLPRTARTGMMAAGLAALAAVPALAHHGWSWTDSGFFKLEGEITAVYVGNPHATMDVDAEGEIWRVELAPPSRTTATGFSEEIAAPGKEVIAIGNRSQDEGERRMKAVRVTIDGTDYDVYPRRASDI